MRNVVVIAEDAAAVRSIRFALRHAAACRVVATLDGTRSARTPLSRWQPDLVLVSDMCQRTNVMARLRESREAAPNATIVTLVRPMDGTAANDAFAAGTHAVISRSLHPHVLGVLLRELTEGNIACAPREALPGAELPRPAHLRAVRDHDAPVARTSP